MVVVAPMDEQRRLTIQLLDAHGEHVVSEWAYAPDEVSVVRIGRAKENDIVISDRFVSRYHAEICYKSGRWELVSTGRHRLLYRGAEIPETYALSTGDHRFELTGSRLSLRVAVDQRPGGDDPWEIDATTSMFTSSPLEMEFTLDRSEIHRSVDEIQSGGLFDHLQDARRRMGRRDGEGNEDR